MKYVGDEPKQSKIDVSGDIPAMGRKICGRKRLVKLVGLLVGSSRRDQSRWQRRNASRHRWAMSYDRGSTP
jgi:hypothetical protein